MVLRIISVSANGERVETGIEFKVPAGPKPVREEVAVKAIDRRLRREDAVAERHSLRERGAWQASGFARRGPAPGLAARRQPEHRRRETPCG
jgi:hypothetical protein